MATQKKREKRRLNRMKKHQDPETLDTDLQDGSLEGDELVVKEAEEESPIEKDYAMAMSVPGPTSYEELEAAKAAREQAEKVREETWTVQDLVYNIAYHPEMSADDKSKAIVQVGKDFGKRLKSIVSHDMEMEKQADMDVLELRSVIGRDARRISIPEKAIDFLVTKMFSPQPDSKAFLRKKLKDAANLLEQDPQNEIRNQVPDLLKSAKNAGIGGDSAVLIEKDISGQWRAVLFPSNNFKDRDGEIISKAAHEEYVEWINKNMPDAAPVFATWHLEGTARTYPMDFIGFDNGFLIESCPLTENEAASLLKMQETMDIGLSIGGVALARDPKHPHIILKYRQFEVSDLPLARAANPFTDVEVIVKEAHMKSDEMRKYLTGMLGPERAESVMSKMALTQKELQNAGVEEKEAKGVDETKTPAESKSETPAASTVNIDEIVERVAKEFGMEELSQQFQTMKEQAEKVPVLEELVKQLATSKQDDLAEMIQPPVSRQLSWMGTRPSQSKENVLNKEKDEDKDLQKSVPELGWLSEATGTQPVQG